MLQPSGGLLLLLLAAPLSWRCVQVSPPSVDLTNTSGAGAALRLFSCPRKAASQTYTLPKKGLLAALSAHTCSLSLKTVDDCLLMTTGAFQALLLPAAAP